MTFLHREARPSASVLSRLAAATWRQSARTPRCPDAPRLDGKLALVTGGNSGIGLETSLGLARRGAEVVIAARGEEAGRSAANRLTTSTNQPAHYLPLDLADARSSASFPKLVETRFPGRRIDVLVANAGLWPREHRLSPQGHELAFATNVLGHHVLIRGLQAAGKLARARVVIVTGDIYVMARDASPDFQFSGPGGGREAYCRSKLANVWHAHELQRRFPELEVVLVHPGVVASGLGGRTGSLGDWVKSKLLISCEEGAQTSLIAATQPGVAGKYLHNTLGVVTLPESDPGLQQQKAALLWDQLEALAGPA